MNEGITRRQASSALGTVSLGALLAACDARGSDGGASSTATVPTESGGSATVEPQTPSSADLVSLFDEASTCTLTPEETSVGAQVTNEDGIVQFVTVYPGWYRGRTVHIHVKVHPNGSDVLTSQLYFDEDVTEAVYRDATYASHTGRDTFNGSDGIFDPQMLLTLSSDAEGHLGLMTIGVGA